MKKLGNKLFSYLPKGLFSTQIEKDMSPPTGSKKVRFMFRYYPPYHLWILFIKELKFLLRNEIYN